MNNGAKTNVTVTKKLNVSRFLLIYYDPTSKSLFFIQQPNYSRIGINFYQVSIL